MNGQIHSVETFGTVDGPGVRFVVFLQGCPLRCKYCHNPDTWEMGGGESISAGELMEHFHKNRSFYRKGGITVTGGEPLMQIDFLLEFFAMAKEQNVHTCIDTSGITFGRFGADYREKLDRLTELTDLVMLDLKHMDSDSHRDLTGSGNEGVIAFARYLEEKKIPLWIRHVIIPGITDSEEHQTRLGQFIATLSNVKALDVLPYHTLGVKKYRDLNIPYPLESTPPATSESAREAKKVILEAYKEECLRRAGRRPAPATF